MKTQLHFRDLECWQESRRLTLLVYQLTIPDEIEMDWDFSRQIRRASISIMNNISEGYSRFKPQAMIQFLRIALGSCAEVESMCLLGEDLKYFQPYDKDKITSLCNSIRRMILGLIRYQQSRKS